MLLPAIVALALTANPHLDEGAALFDRMLYEKAVAKLKRAIAVSASSEAERRRAHDLLARSLVALGQNDEARRTFVALLSIDPRAPLPADASPNIRRLFLDAKEQLYPKGKAVLRRVPAPLPRLTVELVDPWDDVARVELRLEPPASVAVEPAPLMNAELPDGTRSATVLALSASNETLGSLGPLTFDTAATPAPAAAVSSEPAPAPGPKWPVIATGAVSMALLAAGAALSVAAAADSNTAGQQRFASDIRAYDDSARDKGIAGAVLLGAAAVGGAATAVIYFTW